MSAYDPFTLWLMERERLHRDLEHRRRRDERAALTTASASGERRPAETAPSAGMTGRRGIHRLLPGDA